MTAVQSVERAIALLSAIADRPGGLVELAETADLPTSTAARLLGTLKGAGAVRRDDSGVYRIGPTITSMSSASDFEPSLDGAAYPHMVELVGTLDEAVGLSVPAGDDVVTVVQADVPRAIQAEDWSGSRWPLHLGSSGHVLMATWPEPEVDAYLAGIGDAAPIRERVALARAHGVAWSHGDYVVDLSSVAAAIVDASGAGVATLYAYGPSYRFPAADSLSEVEREVRDKAERISRAWSAQSIRGSAA